MQVVGALLDAEAQEEFVINLILSVRSLLPVDQVRPQRYRKWEGAWEEGAGSCAPRLQYQGGTME